MLKIILRKFPFQIKSKNKREIINSFNIYKLSLDDTHVLIGTDGSKTKFRTTVAGIDYTNRKSFSGSIDTYCSNNSAEIIALMLAIKEFITSRRNYILVSDSMSTLYALKNKKKA